MKKIILTTILISNIISCKNLLQLKSDNHLTEIIETKISTNPQQINLSTIQNFSYDKLLILDPYTNIANTEKELNIDLSNISENKICSRDDINLLVFIKDNKSIKISELSAKNASFVENRILIERKNTIFGKNAKGVFTVKK